jgi:FkbM family methyltransferase
MENARMTDGEESSQWVDRSLERVLWWTLRRIAPILGPRQTRRLAATAMRASSRSSFGWTRNLYRLARRPPVSTPCLFRVPDEWWSSSPHVSVRRVGLKLNLDMRDNLQRTLYFTGAYEPRLMHLIQRELRPGDVMVDIGAHIGVHALTTALRLRTLGSGRVIAFEPAADSAAALRRAASRNRLAVEVVETALGDSDGTAELFSDTLYGPADAGVRSHFGDGDRVQTVPLTSFDAWAARVGLERVNLVKVDVEGAEIAVLRGMYASLRSLRPRLVVVEINRVVMERGPGDETSLRHILAECGYSSSGQVVEQNEIFRPVPAFAAHASSRDPVRRQTLEGDQAGSGTARSRSSRRRRGSSNANPSSIVIAKNCLRA